MNIKPLCCILLFFSAALVSAQMTFPRSDGLPNPAITPGATDRAVTQENLRETICRPGGYTSTVRPDESYTEKLKRKGIRAYGYVQQMGRGAYRLRLYEEDHLIPLEIGGAPADPANLWPEPHNVEGGWGSYTKDKLENRLHDLVCAGKVSLADAQQAIATDWISAYQQYVGMTPER